MFRLRALVTGAAGFCGRHLIGHLEAIGVEPFGLDRVPCGPRGFTVQEGDRAGLLNAIERARPTHVLHLAGCAYSESISDYYRANTLMAADLLEALKAAGFEKAPLLLAGTSAEYGRVAETDLPIRESHPARPYSHYGISKLAQTQMGLASVAEGRPVVVIRPFNIVGPGMPHYLSIGSFARQLAAGSRGGGRVLIETGNLETTRDFIDVRIAVVAYWDILQKQSAYGRIFNLCSGRESKMRDLLTTMVDASGLDVELRVDRNRLKRIDIERHFGDPSELEKLLGRSFSSDLSDCLRDTVRSAIGSP